MCLSLENILGLFIIVNRLTIALAINVDEYTPYNEQSNGNENEDRLTYFLKKEYSLTKPYPGSWNFGGSTILHPDVVRLTAAQPSQRGWVSCPASVGMRNWEVHVTFKVHSNDDYLSGDGLGFWYVHPNTQMGGKVFGSQDNFTGLGVFLDTYSNNAEQHMHEHPYLSAMLGNGSVSYDHDSDGVNSELAGCTAKVRNQQRETILAISYISNNLIVSTRIQDNDGWQRCFSISNLILPTHYRFAVSAMTGELVDNHDLLTVRVYELDSPELSGLSLAEAGKDLKNIVPHVVAVESEHGNKGQQQQSSDDSLNETGTASNWRFSIYILSFVFAAAAVVAIAFAIWQRQQRMRKRFY